MARSAPIFTNFTAGELSPRLEGRIDLQKYANGCKTLENMIVQKHGPASRRGGFYYSAEVKDSTKKTRILPFEFSATQAYILEFGDQYVRFYKNYGQIKSGAFDDVFAAEFDTGGPHEIATPYLEAELFELVITQSADVLYIAHQNHEPRTLSRLGDTNWELDIIQFLQQRYSGRHISHRFNDETRLQQMLIQFLRNPIVHDNTLLRKPHQHPLYQPLRPHLPGKPLTKHPLQTRQPERPLQIRRTANRIRHPSCPHRPQLQPQDG